MNNLTHLLAVTVPGIVLGIAYREMLVLSQEVLH